MIMILTGKRGVGKTTLLLKLIEELKNQQLKVSGILTPAIYDSEGNKIGFYAANAATGDRWELGRSDRKLDGPIYGSFNFSKSGFTRATKILKKVLTEDSGTVILDEIGPLELRKGYGFFPVLSLIRSFNINRNLYLVIRPELTDEFIRRFIPESEFEVMRITLGNRDDFNRGIAKLYKEEE